MRVSVCWFLVVQVSLFVGSVLCWCDCQTMMLGVGSAVVTVGGLSFLRAAEEAAQEWE